MARTHAAERITYAMMSTTTEAAFSVCTRCARCYATEANISATVSQYAVIEAVVSLPERAPHINKPATVCQPQMTALHEDGLAD
jgi:hypothetical protein